MLFKTKAETGTAMVTGPLTSIITQLINDGRSHRGVGFRQQTVWLVKAFLTAGGLTELGDGEDTHTGAPPGGILSPLIFNVAMSVLDEHLHRPWKPGG